MIQTSWQEEEDKLKKEISATSKKINRIGRWLFLALIMGILTIMAFGGFYLYQYLTASEISFLLKAPGNAQIGVPFNIEIDISNDSDKLLKDAEISMVLPEGTAFLTESPDKRILNKTIGDLDTNTSFQEKIPVIIFKNEQSVKKFDATVFYFPPSLGPKMRFEEVKSVEVAVREPGIKLDLVAPQKVLNNEDFEIEVDYQNISDIDFLNVELEFDYPETFTFKNSSLKPSTGNNLWNVGDLNKKSQAGNLIIQGRAINPENSFFEIKGKLKIELFGQKYLISEKTASINIAPSPLSLNIVVNDQPNYLAFLGDRLRYKIIYRNSSDIGLNDVVIKARLIGEMFNFINLRTSGFFNSKDNTITWNAANTPALRFLSAEERAVEFEIQTKESYPINRISDKNFVLKIEAEISSPTVPYYVASDKTIGFAKSEIKVAGNVVVGAEASFLGGFSPPKANEQSTYLVRWTIANYSTDISNIEIKSYLQSGVRWVGQEKSNINSVPNYNERTQEIIWPIDSISATKGVISKPVEATFQIEATPNITQIGQHLPLLSETTFRAFDEFAKIELKSVNEAISVQSMVKQ